MEIPFTMRAIFHALIKEEGEAEGKRLFEWYCTTYRVTIADVAPDTVVYEVLGLTKEENAAGVALRLEEGTTYRATDLRTGVSIKFTEGDFNGTQVVELPAGYVEAVVGGEVEDTVAASATAGAMYRIGAFLAMHRPEIAGAK